MWIRRPKRWLFSAKRFTSWGIVIACVLFLLALMGLPAVADRLAEQIVSRIEMRSGLDVVYSNMSIRPFSVGVVFHEVEIHPLNGKKNEEQQPLIKFDRVSLGVNLWYMLTHTGKRAVNVSIANPSKVEMCVNAPDGSVALPPSLNELWKGLLKFNPALENVNVSSVERDMAAQAPACESRWRLHSLEIGGLNVDVGVTSGAAHRLFNLDKTHIGISLASANYGVSAKGSLHSAGGVRLPFLLSAVFSREWRPISFDFKSDDVYLPWPLFEPTVAVTATPLDLHVSLTHLNKSPNVALNVSALVPALSIGTLDKKRQLNDYNCSMSLALLLNRDAESRRLTKADLLGLDLDSRFLRAGFSGSISRMENEPWEIGLKLHKVGGDWKNLLVGTTPFGFELPGDKGVITADLIARGDAGLRLNSLTGVLDIGDVTVDSPALPFPFHNVRGHIKLADDSFDIENLNVASADDRSSAALSACFKGDWLHRKQGELSATWDINVDMEQLLRDEKKPDAIIQGRFASSGSIDHLLTFVDSFSSATAPASFSGKIDLSDFSAVNSVLPLDVRDLNANLDLDSDRFSVSTITGHVGSLDLNSSATIVREAGPDGWKNATIESRTQVTGKVADAVALTTAVKEWKPPNWLRDDDARFALDLGLRGGLLSVGHWVPDFTFSVKGLTVPIETPACKTNLEVRDGTLAFADGRLTLSDIVLQPAPAARFNLNGSVTPADGMTVKVHGDEIDLAKLLQIMPKATPWQEAKGHVSMEGTFALPPKYVPSWPKTDAPDTQHVNVSQLTGWLGEFGRAVSSAYAKGYLVASGTVKTSDKDGCNYTHYFMPEKHKDKAGNDIDLDAAINNIRGTVNWALEPKPVSKEFNALKPCMFTRFTAPASKPLQVSLPGSDPCKLSGFVLLRPGTFPQMEINLDIPGRAMIDPWSEAWGKRIKRLRAEGKIPTVNTDYTRNYDLVVALKTGHAYLRGVDLGAFNAKMTYRQTNTPDGKRSWKFSMPDSTGKFPNGGAIRYSLDLRNDTAPVDGSVTVPTHWKHTINVSDGDVSDLSKFFMPKANISYTGRYDAMDVVMEGDGDDRQTVSGAGSVSMRNFRFRGSRLFGLLGELSGITLEDFQFYTLVPLRFAVHNGIIYVGRSVDGHVLPPAQLSANDLRLNFVGTCSYIDYSLNMVFRLMVLRTTGLVDGTRAIVHASGLHNVPILGEVAGMTSQMVSEVAAELDRQFSHILAFNVGGTLERPSVTPTAIGPVLELFRSIDEPAARR